MSQIKKLIVGTTTEALIRTLFDNRIAEESTSNDLNTFTRARQIKDLSNQVLAFIKRNPNSVFTVIAPEFKFEKTVTLRFSNFADEENDDDSLYTIHIQDNFIVAEVTKFVEMGGNIKLILKAE